MQILYNYERCIERFIVYAKKILFKEGHRKYALDKVYLYNPQKIRHGSLSP